MIANDMERYNFSKKEQFIATSPPLERIKELRPPYNFLVRIVGKNQHVLQCYGTGCIIAENIVLTCLHILVHEGKVFKAHQLKVYVGQSGPNEKYTPFEVYGLQYNQKYFDKSQQKNSVLYDYALLLLNPEKEMHFDKNILKLYAPRIESIKDRKNYIFELYGYDKNYNDDYNNKQRNGLPYQYHLWGIQTDMWKTGGGGRIIEYKVSTDSGKSGAPLIVYNKQGKFKIIGIHLAKLPNGSQLANYALMITKEILQQIKQWGADWQKNETDLIATQYEHFKHQTEQENPSVFTSNSSKLPSIKPKATQEQVVLDLGKILLRFLENLEDQDLFEAETGNSRQLQTSIYSKEDLKKYCSKALHVVENLQIKIREFNFNLVTEMCNLKNLSLVACNLTEVPLLNNLLRLQTIDCSGNYIVDASNFFTPRVICLTLDSNLIERITEAVADATSLKTLSLNQNKKLRYIDLNILKIKDTLQTLKLNGCNLLIQFQNLDAFNQIIDELKEVQSDF